MGSYGWIDDLRAEVEVPRGGILSRTIHEGEALTLTVFAFDTGQELTEHTSSRAAVIEIVEGEAEVTLDGLQRTARAGSWIAIPAGMRHAIRASAPLIMALTLVRPGDG